MKSKWCLLHLVWCWSYHEVNNVGGADGADARHHEGGSQTPAPDLGGEEFARVEYNGLESDSDGHLACQGRAHHQPGVTCQNKPD